jgi:hypothetical protein
MKRLLAAALFFAPFAAHAQEVEDVILFGIGINQACGDFIAASTPFAPGQFRVGQSQQGPLYSGNKAFLEWASGFISAANTLHPTRQDRRLSAAGMDLWIRNFCSANPAEPFSNAVTAYLKSGGIWP